MAKYDGDLGPTDCRFLIHGGFFDTDIDRSYGEYYKTEGSYVVAFETNDKEQAYRIFDSIYENDCIGYGGITGMYMHQQLVWHHGEYHAELETCGHAIDMRWYLEDYEDDSFDWFDVPIFEQPYEEN